MKKIYIRAMLVLFAVSMLILTSCKKKDTTTGSITQDASNQTQAENMYNDVHHISDQAASNGSVSYKTAGDQTVNSSATVTIDSFTSPGHYKITVDFGTTDVVCADGRLRRGQILIDHQGRYWDIGTVITTTFNGYYVNDNQVLGTHTVTNTANNGSGQPTFHIQVDGSIVLANNGGTIVWHSTRTRTYLAGYNTPGYLWDDKIQVEGTANGTAASGNTFSATITNPLIRDFTCLLGQGRWHFVQGTIDLQIASKPEITIDYGTGTCDNIATATINGSTYTFTLR